MSESDLFEKLSARLDLMDEKLGGRFPGGWSG